MSSPHIDTAFPANRAVETFNIFELLKKDTADIHQLTEQRVPVFREGFNLEEYTRLVERFFGFWAPIEYRLSDLTALRDPGLALQSRLKCSLIKEDLETLGSDPASVRLCDKLPPLNTFSQGIGCLYVLEGSTLGSQIISRHLKEKLQLNAGSGASFFNAYGSLVGPRWMEFTGYVSARIKYEHAGDVVESARQTFLCFYDWLGTTAERGGIRAKI